MNKNSPIGIFDSGVGGTSIWKELHELMPLEHTTYLADSKNAPYGSRSPEEIIALSVKNTEKLIAFGCKLIVVACNTATTNAIATLRATFDIPFIGIEPAIKPAALNSVSGNIGILATRGTLNSELFTKTSETLSNHINIIEIIGEGLVPLIESGKLDSEATKSLLKKYTKPMIDAQVDYIVLGCSHYPYLIPALKTILPDHIRIIDSGKAVARQTKTILKNLDFLRSETTNPNLTFYTNDNPAILKDLLAVYANKITVEKLNF